MAQYIPTELGTRSIPRLLFQYAVPAIIAMTAASLYNIVDSIFIGHIGPDGSWGNSDGMAILFESSKLLTMLQTLSAMSGNTQLQTIGEIAKSYDGLRVGFDMKK